MKASIEKSWRQKSWLTVLLYPLSLLFGLISSVRRWAYRLGILRSIRLPKPTIVVGNISVGGTGKTPFVQALVRSLQSKGLKVGILSRGYGGDTTHYPHLVNCEQDSPQTVGDEPYMLAKSLGVPVVIDPKRPRGGHFLLSQSPVDVIVTDDGLQHYALARDVEVAIVDGMRRFGNGLLLPAGPLREAPSRLKSADFVVANGGEFAGCDATMTLVPCCFRRVGRADEERPLSAFAGRTVSGVAGIGNPQRFFDVLTELGIEASCRAFPDHHRYESGDFTDLAETILMTEKDAVKCDNLGLKDAWYLVIKPQITPDLSDQILARIGE